MFRKVLGMITCFIVLVSLSGCSKQATLTLEDGSKYTGEVSIFSNKPSGKGVAEFKDHKQANEDDYSAKAAIRYEGTWKNGLMDGSGTLIYGEGSVYTGEMKAGKLEGAGVFTNEEAKVKLEATVTNDTIFGPGKWYQDGKLIYDGIWEGLEMTAGKAYTDGKLVYDGALKDDKYEGAGKLYRNEKLVYEGEFRNDVFEGMGKAYYSDGSLAYEGGWHLGDIDGKGKLYDNQGNLIPEINEKWGFWWMTLYEEVYGYETGEYAHMFNSELYKKYMTESGYPDLADEENYQDDLLKSIDFLKAYATNETREDNKYVEFRKVYSDVKMEDFSKMQLVEAMMSAQATWAKAYADYMEDFMKDLEGIN